MAKFTIEWTTELWHSMTVEADSPEDAEQMWADSGMLFSDETVYDRDYIASDSIQVFEAKEEQE